MLSIFGLCLYFVLERKQQLGEVDTIVAYPFLLNRSRGLIEVSDESCLSLDTQPYYTHLIILKSKTDL